MFGCTYCVREFPRCLSDVNKLVDADNGTISVIVDIDLVEGFVSLVECEKKPGGTAI